MRASRKGTVVAISIATLVVGVWVFAALTPAHIPTSRGIAGVRPSSGYSSSTEWLTNTGIIGNVSIGPVAPACFVGNGTGGVPSPSTSTTVVVTSQSGEQISIPVNWFIWGGCELWGAFKEGLAPGTYSLTLSYCLQEPRGAGCPQSPWFRLCTLPTTVSVERGRLTLVNIGIETGIR